MGIGFNILSYWKQDTKDKFVWEIGGQQSWENHVDNRTTEFSSVRNYVSYRHYLSDLMYIDAGSEYIYEFDQTKGYRINSDVGIVSKLNSRFSLKIGYGVRYDKNPVGDVTKTDTRTTVSLIMDFK